MLTADERKDYQTRGFLNVHALLDPALLSAARNELESFYHDFPQDSRAKLTNYGGAGIDKGQTRIDNPHLISGAVRELLFSGALADAVSELVDCRAIQVWYCHALRKPGALAEANHVGWHQDGQYAPFLGGDFLTAWIPLQDVTDTSSPLIYVSGSHRQGLVRGSGFSHKASLDELKAAILAQHSVAWDEQLTTGRAGFVSFHHSNLIHGSRGNDGNEVRHSIACHLRTDLNPLFPDQDYKNAVAQIRDLELSPIIKGSADALDFGNPQ